MQVFLPCDPRANACFNSCKLFSASTDAELLLRSVLPIGKNTGLRFLADFLLNLQKNSTKFKHSCSKCFIVCIPPTVIEIPEFLRNSEQIILKQSDSSREIRRHCGEICEKRDKHIEYVVHYRIIYNFLLQEIGGNTAKNGLRKV